MMKTIKYAGAIAGLTLACQVAQADGGFYVGAGVAGGGVSTDSTLRNSSGTAIATSNLTGSAGSGTVKFGLILGNGHRMEFGYSSIDATWDGGGTDTFNGFDFDYLVTFDGSIKPYVGVGLGGYTLANSGRYIAGGQDLSGLALNLGAGVIFEVAKNVEIEGALKLKLINWQDLRNSSGQTLEMETGITTLYIGANLRF